MAQFFDVKAKSWLQRTTYKYLVTYLGTWQVPILGLNCRVNKRFNLRFPFCQYWRCQCQFDTIFKCKIIFQFIHSMLLLIQVYYSIYCIWQLLLLYFFGGKIQYDLELTKKFFAKLLILIRVLGDWFFFIVPQQGK